MQKLCWACTEPYDDSLAKCPYCGVPRNAPKSDSVKVEVKRSHKAKVPVKKGK